MSKPKNIVVSPKQLYEIEGKNTIFVKLTNKDECHHKLQYITGLNTDRLDFDSSGECKSGGMYFYSVDQLVNFSFHVYSPKYIRKVTFPSDAKIYIETDKYKADKFFLDQREEFWLPEHLCSQSILNNGLNIRYVRNPTKDLYIQAVLNDGYALEYIPEQSQDEDICLAAVSNKALSLEFVYHQTSNICLAAVKRSYRALLYVKIQTPEICLEAVKQHGLVLCGIKKQTKKICLEAVKQNKLALEYVDTLYLNEILSEIK